MGTIGDLLGGLDLSSFAAAEDEGVSTDVTPTETVANAEEEVGTSSANLNQADATPAEIAMQAVLDETGLEPAAARAQLRLREDLDMDDLSLYAVVSVIERALKHHFADVEVRSWVTLADLLSAVENRSSD